MNAIKNTSLTLGFSLLIAIVQIPNSVADNAEFSAKKTNPTGKHFSATGHPASTAGACGSSTSISAALDQCSKKGFISALCKKKGAKWSCLPSEDKTNPNIRFTGTPSQ